MVLATSDLHLQQKLHMTREQALKTLGRRVAESLGIPGDEITMDYVGLNHLGWMRRVMHRGRDVLQHAAGGDRLLDARCVFVISGARGKTIGGGARPGGCYPGASTCCPAQNQSG